jgi:hypothetical protein
MRSLPQASGSALAFPEPMFAKLLLGNKLNTSAVVAWRTNKSKRKNDGDARAKVLYGSESMTLDTNFITRNLAGATMLPHVTEFSYATQQTQSPTSSPALLSPPRPRKSGRALLPPNWVIKQSPACPYTMSC